MRTMRKRTNWNRKKKKQKVREGEEKDNEEKNEEEAKEEEEEDDDNEGEKGGWKRGKKQEKNGWDWVLREEEKVWGKSRRERTNMQKEQMKKRDAGKRWKRKWRLKSRCRKRRGKIRRVCCRSKWRGCWRKNVQHKKKKHNIKKNDKNQTKRNKTNIHSFALRQTNEVLESRPCFALSLLHLFRRRSYSSRLRLRNRGSSIWVTSAKKKVIRQEYIVGNTKCWTYNSNRQQSVRQCRQARSMARNSRRSWQQRKTMLEALCRRCCERLQ